MMRNCFRSFRLGALALLLSSLAAGCTTRVVVGTDVDPGSSGACQGDCPPPASADGLPAGYSEILDLAVANDGSAVIVGRFGGDLTIAGAHLHAMSENVFDGFVVKLDAAGSPLWAHQIVGNPTSFAVAVRPTGEIVIAGTLQIAPEPGEGAPPSAHDRSIFFGELLPDGTASTSMAWEGPLWVNDLALAPNGDLVITGGIDAPLTLGSFTIAPAGSAEGAQAGVMARVDWTGAVVWANGYDVTMGPISTLPDGGFAVAGAYEGSRALGSLALPSAGAATNGFLAAFDDAGTPAWASRLDPTPDDATDAASGYGASMKVTPDGKIAVLFSSTGDDTVTFVDAHARLQTYEADGTRVGHADLATGNVYTLALGVAPDGDLLVGGSFRDALDVGGASLSAPDDVDAFLARFTPDGADLRWALSFGTPLTKQHVTAVDVAPDGHPIVAGSYMGSFVLGDDELPVSLDNPNAFVATFAP